MCEASTKFKNGCVSDILTTNKIVRKVTSSNNEIIIPKLDLNSLSIKVFTDASFNNLPNGGSQGGQITFITDNENNSCPVHWNSSRLKRVARSTIATETLSLSTG